MVRANGTMTTIAGTGVNTFVLNDTIATRAGIPSPTSVAVDSSGVVYIADSKSVKKMVCPWGL